MGNRREKRARATQKGRRAMTELMKKGLLPVTEAVGEEPVQERKKPGRKPKTEQVKAEQGKAEQVKTEQAKTEQAKAEQGKAEQVKTEQAKTEQAKTEQGKAEQVKTEAVQPRQEQAEKETTTVFVQYAGLESEVGSLTKAALADFKASHKNADVTSLNLYIKPEDHAAYYVINGEFTGKVEL